MSTQWKRWIPWILLIKVGVLGFLLYEYRRGRMQGEVEALAVETEKKEVKKEEKKEEKKSEQYGYLDHLIHLPPIEPEKMKKEELAKYLEIADQAYQKIQLRLEELKRKAAQLEKIEKTIDEKLKKVEEERAFLAQTLQKEKELQKDRAEGLLSFYEKMEPKKAGPLIEKMDKDLVVTLFQKLKKKQVTAILENMNPQKSVELTEYFGRVGSAREYELLKEMNVSLREAFGECKGLSSGAPAQPAVPVAK